MAVQHEPVGLNPCSWHCNLAEPQWSHRLALPRWVQQLSPASVRGLGVVPGQDGLGAKTGFAL